MKLNLTQVHLQWHHLSILSEKVYKANAVKNAAHEIFFIELMVATALL